MKIIEKRGLAKMIKDQALGLTISIGSVAGIAAYFYLVFLSPWTLLIIQISAFAAVATILAIAAWIGYTLYTSSQAPIDDTENTEKEPKISDS